MAQVKWTDEADALFDKYIMNAFVEYGRKTSMRWLNERIKMADRLVNYPTSYPPEELLSDRDVCFRSHQIMGRFKFVHYYDEEIDTVFIVDIWDMKMRCRIYIRGGLADQHMMQKSNCHKHTRLVSMRQRQAMITLP